MACLIPIHLVVISSNIWVPVVHDLVKLKDAEHFERCDFSESETVVPTSSASTMSSYSYACEAPGEVRHVQSGLTS